MNKQPQISSILLVDDNPATNNFNRLLLMKFGFCSKIEISENGQEALKYLQSLSEDEYPNLIFLDLNMPIMNGREFLESFEKEMSSGFDKIKVVLLSTSTDVDDVNLAQQFSNVVSFMLKPLNKASIDSLWTQLKAS
ncbi:MAG: response regulator [Flavobacteriales bacterium]|nr:response regulator [Flavobacteriales bacterium]